MLMGRFKNTHSYNFLLALFSHKTLLEKGYQLLKKSNIANKPIVKVEWNTKNAQSPGKKRTSCKG